MSALVIGVNYRTDEHAMTFARSLARYPPEDVSVILVDNSERDDPDGFSRQILEANPQIRCIEAPRNLGYFGGADHGLKQYLASSELPDWVIVCNVDIEFRDPQFFTALRELESVESLGVVAPCIWSARWKRDLNPKIAQRPTKGRMLFYKFILGNYYLQTIYELLSVFKNGLKASLGLVLASFRGFQGRGNSATLCLRYTRHTARASFLVKDISGTRAVLNTLCSSSGKKSLSRKAQGNWGSRLCIVL